MDNWIKMKINEVIAEGKERRSMRKMHSQALPNLTQYDALDNNANPYLAYRFAVAMAGSPGGDMDKRGPIGSNFNTIDYTDADAEIRRGAERIMGIKPSRSTGRGSKELPSVTTTSPVAKIKKNKYGV
jgi:hypothetical protein